jgi:hypothetical protein
MGRMPIPRQSFLPIFLSLSLFPSSSLSLSHRSWRKWCTTGSVNHSCMAVSSWGLHIEHFLVCSFWEIPTAPYRATNSGFLVCFTRQRWLNAHVRERASTKSRETLSRAFLHLSSHPTTTQHNRHSPQYFESRLHQQTSTVIVFSLIGRWILWAALAVRDHGQAWASRPDTRRIRVAGDGKKAVGSGQQKRGPPSKPVVI